MVERQARDQEVRGSNPGPGSNFSLEFQYIYSILIEKDLCECRKLSVMFPWALLVCVFHPDTSSFSLFIPIFVLSSFEYFSFLSGLLYSS